MPLGPGIAVTMDVPPYRLSGTVYGALLNHRRALQALGDAVNRPPYNGAPQAPVLYIKPRNTLAADGDAVAVPPGVAELEIGASLGLVIGRPAAGSRRTARLESCRRLSDRERRQRAPPALLPAVDPLQGARRLLSAGSARCPARTALANPDALTIRVYVDGDAAADGEHLAAGASGGEAAG